MKMNQKGGMSIYQEKEQMKKMLASKPFLILKGCYMVILDLFLVTGAFYLVAVVAKYLKAIQGFKATGEFEGSALVFLTPTVVLEVFPQWLLLIIFLCSLLFAGVHTVLRLYDTWNAFKDINFGTKGTEKFTTKEELDQQYKKVALDDNEYEGHAGIPVASVVEEDGQHYVYIDDNKTNSLTVGATQSGKTEMFSYPFLDLIMRAKIKDSVIVNDLKGDMLKNTKADFERFGYEVFCLNLVEPENGIRYNPLELVRKAYFNQEYSKAQMYANAFAYSLYHNDNAKEPMWQEASIALLNALILAVCEIAQKQQKIKYVNMYAIVTMLEELGGNPDQNGVTALDKYFEKLPLTSVARKQYATIKFSQGVTRSGIITNTMAKLKNYTYDAIARLTAENDLDLEAIGFGEKPIALFIVYPDWNDANYTIIATLLSQLNEVLSERATLSSQNATTRRVHYLLEEVANIPEITGLARAMNVGLGRGLIYHLVIQSYAQLDDKYSKELAKAITGACGNQIYIMSDELDDAEYFSKKLGQATVVTGDRHGDPLAMDKSYGEREEGRELLTTNELRDLMPGEWILDRTKKRRDLENNIVKPYPILAGYANNLHMMHRYEYLNHRFSNSESISSLNLKVNQDIVQLSDIVIPFNVKYADDDDDNQERLNTIEEIAKTKTRISKQNSKYLFLKKRLKSVLSEMEYDYFEELKTLEEIEQFLKVPAREEALKIFRESLV